MGLLLYLLVGLLAINFPTHGFRIAVRATSIVIFLLLGSKIAYNFRQGQISSAKYDRNLANGTLVVMISLVVLTALYDKRWHKQLNNVVVEVKQDVIAFFRFNTTNPDGYPIPSPVLWFIVYDPELSFEEAYTKGYGVANLFNANGVTTINIGLNYVRPMNGTAYYNYDVVFSTAGNLNLVCDVSKNTTQLCYASLIIQIPRFDRTVQTQKMSMQWPVSRAPVSVFNWQS
ncbi:MAG: hypothetical protein Q9169_006298 [Polycauliona sp. 2 TL-2023]